MARNCGNFFFIKNLKKKCFHQYCCHGYQMSLYKTCLLPEEVSRCWLGQRYTSQSPIVQTDRYTIRIPWFIITINVLYILAPGNCRSSLFFNRRSSHEPSHLYITHDFRECSFISYKGSGGFGRGQKLKYFDPSLEEGRKKLSKKAHALLEFKGGEGKNFQAPSSRGVRILPRAPKGA